jgi:hypothetical protein
MQAIDLGKKALGKTKQPVHAIPPVLALRKCVKHKVTRVQGKSVFLPWATTCPSVQGGNIVAVWLFKRHWRGAKGLLEYVIAVDAFSRQVPTRDRERPTLLTPHTFSRPALFPYSRQKQSGMRTRLELA